MAAACARLHGLARRLDAPPAWLAALVAAVVAAEVGVLVLRPRRGIIGSLATPAHRCFSQAEIQRARDYRRPQLPIYAGSLLLQGALLVVLTRRPPGVLRRRHARPALAAGAAGAAGSIALGAVALPLSAISRRRAANVGLSTQSWRGWGQDVVRSTAISAALTGAGAAGALELKRRFPRFWWLPGSLGVVIGGVAAIFAGPVVLDPLFNRFEALADERTRTDVLALARQAGVEVGQVYVVDASRRTTAANAYVTGLGTTKRVVLYDTLLSGFSPEEVRLVVAHELGHVHHADIARGLLYLALVAPAGLLAVACVTDRLAARPPPPDARRPRGPAGAGPLTRPGLPGARADL